MAECKYCCDFKSASAFFRGAGILHQQITLAKMICHVDSQTDVSGISLCIEVK